MDATQVNQVVDKLAEKIGVAVDKVQPLAVETVAQISQLGQAYVLTGVAALILVIVCVRTLIRFAPMIGDPEKSVVVCDRATTIAVIASVVGLIGIIVALSTIFGFGMPMWIAPIPYLLGLN